MSRIKLSLKKTAEGIAQRYPYNLHTQAKKLFYGIIYLSQPEWAQNHSGRFDAAGTKRAVPGRHIARRKTGLRNDLSR